jgi:DNA repair protein RadC
MKGAFDEHPEQESFWVIALNRKNFAKGRQMISLGSATAAIAHPREIFRAAILMSATAIICVHNHPSGDPHPSSADLQLTRQIREAARTVEIELLDHVIIGEIDADPLKKGFYSFRENGLV